MFRMGALVEERVWLSGCQDDWEKNRGQGKVWDLEVWAQGELRTIVTKGSHRYSQVAEGG